MASAAAAGCPYHRPLQQQRASSADQQVCQQARKGCKQHVAELHRLAHKAQHAQGAQVNPTGPPVRYLAARMRHTLLRTHSTPVHAPRAACNYIQAHPPANSAPRVCPEDWPLSQLTDYISLSLRAHPGPSCGQSIPATQMSLARARAVQSAAGAHRSCARSACA